MADKKISQLTALAAANLAPSTDVLAIVDTSATETKKIVAQDLINGVLNVASAVGIGTSSPGAKLEAYRNTSGEVARFTASSDGFRSLKFVSSDNTGSGAVWTRDIDSAYAQHRWAKSGTPLMVLDESGNLGVGTTSPGKNLEVAAATDTTIRIRNTTTSFSNAVYGTLDWATSDSSTPGGIVAKIDCLDENIYGDRGALRFFTNNSVSLGERGRFTAAGEFLVAKTLTDVTTVGTLITSDGRVLATTGDADCMVCNRQNSDGTLMEFRQANTTEGTISVSGNTVSYNSFAGSHWSQLQDGSKPDILRGTVMESINELCVWPGENNERLPKAKISDTAGSKKVYGVFMAWDNDWTETNDMYVTAVGAFICRVNGSVTVQEGDLLESNGDGTARVQADDIIRSSTIGKVTSTVKTHEYDDGSYCVPTVLYCG